MKKMTVEQLFAPDYFAADSLIGVASPFKIYCITVGGNRMYWAFDSNDEVVFFKGVSNFIQSSVPVELLGKDYITEWAIENFNSILEYKEFLNIASAYGKFLHWQICKFVESGRVNKMELENDLAEFMLDEAVSHKAYYYKWLEDAKSDLLSFRTFVREYKVRVLAVEFPIAGSWGVASRIDLICLMDLPLKKDGTPYARWPKDTSKVENWLTDVLAIGDIKSKLYSKQRGTFYPANGFQVYAYRKLWNDAYARHFPQLKVDFVFNWSPAGKDEGFNFYPWTKVIKDGETGTMEFDSKLCTPEMLDDIIAFHVKHLRDRAFSFTTIEFDNITLNGGADEFTIKELMDIALRYKPDKQPDL